MVQDGSDKSCHSCYILLILSMARDGLWSNQLNHARTVFDRGVYQRGSSRIQFAPALIGNHPSTRDNRPRDRDTDLPTPALVVRGHRGRKSLRSVLMPRRQSGFRVVAS